MRFWRRGLLVVALMGASAACTPLRVDIAEQPAGGFLAAVHGKDKDECREARARATEEARYHCEARGQRTRLGTPAAEAAGAGCRMELPFWCTGAIP